LGYAGTFRILGAHHLAFEALSAVCEASVAGSIANVTDTVASGIVEAVLRDVDLVER
jgi:hypothetical protein